MNRTSRIDTGRTWNYQQDRGMQRNAERPRSLVRRPRSPMHNPTEDTLRLILNRLDALEHPTEQYRARSASRFRPYGQTVNRYDTQQHSSRTRSFIPKQRFNRLMRPASSSRPNGMDNYLPPHLGGFNRTGHQPRQQSRRPQPRTSNRSVSWASRQHPPEMSVNTDFSALIREFHAVAQIAHHQTNWRECPPSIRRNIDNVIDSIHLPRENSLLRSKLIDAARSFKDALHLIAIGHLETAHKKARHEIRNLDNTDQKRAIEIAESRLRRRLGNRFNDAAAKIAIQRAASEARSGTDLSLRPPNHHIEPLLNVNEAPQPIPTNNRYEALQVDEDFIDAETDNPDASIIPPTPSNTRTKKRRLSSDNVFHTVLRDSKRNTNSSFRMHRGGKVTRKIEPFPDHMVAYAITDSNGARWEENNPFPATTIDVFPGINLEMTATLLEAAADSFKHTTAIVVAVGINDRSNFSMDSICNSMHRLLQVANRTGNRLIFSSAPCFQHLPEEIRDNIRTINSYAVDIFGEDNCASLPDELITPINSDPDCVHYTDSTAVAIMGSIFDLLN